MDKIVGIGNALVDVLVQLKDENPLMQLQLPKGGMQLIDDTRQTQIAALMKSWNPAMATGGSAGNTILALANLQAQPGFVGRIGNDEMGAFFSNNCKATGIDARLVTCDKHTGVANTFITPDGERTFATHLGAADLQVGDITPDLFRGYQLLHIEGYLVQNHDLMETICRTAHEMGLKTSIDLASYNVVLDNFDFMHHLVEDYIDIVFANEEESAAFTRGKEPDEALEEIASMCEIAVVKLGSRGSSAMRDGVKAYAPGRKFGVVDTTAAGDFFAGGFLYGVTYGATLEKSLLVGAMLAGQVVRVVGSRLSDDCWQQIRKDVEELLK